MEEGALDAAGLRATVGVSSVTLGGLIKHLALVEDDYFSGRLFDRKPSPPPLTDPPAPSWRQT